MHRQYPIFRPAISFEPKTKAPTATTTTTIEFHTSI
jgi:hypothetical protein